MPKFRDPSRRGRLATLLLLAAQPVVVSCEGHSPKVECKTDDDCGEQQRCIEKVCVQLCNTDTDCAGDEECNAGACQRVENPVCTADEECTSATECELAGTARCRAGRCQYDARPSGTTCDDKDPCTEGDLCDGEGTCAAISKVCIDPPASECLASDTLYRTYSSPGSCDPATGNCSYSPIDTVCASCFATCLSCSVDADCEPDEYCSADDKCTPKAPDGGHCATEGVHACDSGYCDGELCCSAGDCCNDKSECPESYASASVCTDASATTDCRGTREDKLCVLHVCSSQTVDDDSGCAGIEHACPDHLAPVVCTAAEDQSEPACPADCSGGWGCEPGYTCRGGTCTSFAFRRPITVNRAQVGSSCSSSLADFPLLVTVTGDASLKSKSNGGHVESDQGFDILFGAADGVTRLDHELELYDGVAGTLVAWVRIPTLSNSDDTSIYMVYGNSSITSSLENPAGVWDAGYVGVWHLGESSGTRFDSTASGNDLSDVNGVPQGTGRIGNAADFESSAAPNHFLSKSEPTTLDIHVPSPALTVSGWVRMESYGSFANIGFVSKYDFGTDNRQYSLQSYRVATEPACYPLACPQLVISSNGDIRGEGRKSSGVDLNRWYQLVGVYDGNVISLYVNGVLDAEADQNPFSFPGGPFDGNSDFVIGAYLESGVDTRNLDGRIDEVRVSNVVRTPCWIETTYANQKELSELVRVGAEE